MLALLGAFVIAGFHGIAHFLLGNPASFAAAAVTPVGFVVFVVAFIVIFALRGL